MNQFGATSIRFFFFLSFFNGKNRATIKTVAGSYCLTYIAIHTHDIDKPV